MNISARKWKNSGDQFYFGAAEQVCAHCDKFARTVNKLARTMNKFPRTVNKFPRKSICFRAEVKSCCGNKNVSASSSYFPWGINKTQAHKNWFYI